MYNQVSAFFHLQNSPYMTNSFFFCLVLLIAKVRFVLHLFQFQDDKEKSSVPVVQLNVIRLLANLNVAINKSEVVDMILPLFIESLEEGDASTPSLLRLRVWNLYC